MPETIIKLEATTTIAQLNHLQKQFMDVINEEDVAVDLSEVTKFDTAAVQLLAVFSGSRKKAGRSVTWLGESAVVNEVLGLLGMGSVCYEP
jgi:anti-anti-sigma regulatory factor